MMQGVSVFFLDNISSFCVGFAQIYEMDIGNETSIMSLPVV
jgi:hypothetical protein